MWGGVSVLTSFPQIVPHTSRTKVSCYCLLVFKKLPLLDRCSESSRCSAMSQTDCRLDWTQVMVLAQATLQLLEGAFKLQATLPPRPPCHPATLATLPTWPPCHPGHPATLATLASGHPGHPATLATALHCHTLLAWVQGRAEKRPGAFPEPKLQAKNIP